MTVINGFTASYTGYRDQDNINATINYYGTNQTNTNANDDNGKSGSFIQFNGVKTYNTCYINTKILAAGGGVGFNGGHGIYIGSGVTVHSVSIDINGALLGGGGGGGGGAGGAGGGGGAGNRNGGVVDGVGGSSFLNILPGYGGGGGPGQAGNNGNTPGGTGGGGYGGAGAGPGAGPGYTPENGSNSTAIDTFIFGGGGGGYSNSARTETGGGGGGYGGGAGGGYSGQGGGGGGGGYGPNNVGHGGYSIYNLGTIAYLFNHQGGKSYQYGPLFYGGSKLPLNYEIYLESQTRYGQLYCTGWSTITTGSMNITTSIYSNFSPSAPTTFTYVLVGKITSIDITTVKQYKSTSYYWKLIKYPINSGPLNGYDRYDLYMFTVPGPPGVNRTGFSGSSLNDYIYLDFVASSDTGGNTPVTFEYRLYLNDTTVLTDWTAVSYTTNNNVNNTRIVPPPYAFGGYITTELRARNEAGTSSAFFATGLVEDGYVESGSNKRRARPYTVPGAPGIINVTPGNGRFTFTIVPPTNTGGSPVDQYQFYYPPGTYESDLGSSGGPTNYTHTVGGGNLTNQVYTLYVRTLTGYAGAYKVSSYTTTTVTPYTAPGAPGTYGTSMGYTDSGASIAFDFTPAAANGSTISRYEYQLYNDSGVTRDWVTVDPLTPIYYSGTTTVYYYNSKLAPTSSQYGPTYKIRLRAVNAAGLEGPSDIFRDQNGDKTFTPYIAPSAPTSVSLSVTDNSTTITVSVDQGNQNGSNVDGYYYNVNNAAYSAFIAYAGAPDPFSFTVSTNIAFGISYSIGVIVRNAAGNSDQRISTSSVTPIGKPSAPASLALIAGFGSITYTIGDAPTNGRDIIRYEYIVGSGSYVNSLLSKTGTIYNLQTGTTYTVSARAVNSVGDGAVKSENVVIPEQTVSVIPTKNYFFYNGNTLDTIYKLNPAFGGSDIKYTNNAVDIGKRYITGTTSTYYKYQSANQFTPTTITNTPLPVDRLSITTKNAILSDRATATATTMPTFPEASIFAGVYGCKLLFSSYTGPVMTIRSSINNVTGHFFADSNGNLGSEYLATGTSLSTWLNGTTAHVQIWWDQTGNGNHAYQSTLNSQPTYDITNKYITFTTTTFFNLSNEVHPYGNRPYTYVFKCSITNTNGGIFGGGTINNNYYVHGFRRQSNYYIDYWWVYNIESSAGSYADNSVITVWYDGVNRKMFQNRTLIVGPIPMTGRQQTIINNTIGKSSDTSLDGYIEYMYIIPLAISDLDRNILESTYFTYNYNLASKCYGCYSMRLAIPTYTGPIINVTINATTYSFYTDPMQTYFTTGANNTGSSFSSIIGSFTAYINIWYNQNGGTNHLFQDSSEYRPQIAIQNGKYVIQFENTSIRHFLKFTNGLGTTTKTIFSHFKRDNSNTNEICTLIQAGADYGLRFFKNNSDGNFYFNANNNADWYAQGSGTKLAYNNNVERTYIHPTEWNVLSTSVTTPYMVDSLKYIAYDVNNGRGLNGYMVEIILNNTTMTSFDMQQFYNNRLF